MLIKPHGLGTRGDSGMRAFFWFLMGCLFLLFGGMLHNSWPLFQRYADAKMEQWLYPEVCRIGHKDVRLGHKYYTINCSLFKEVGP